MPSPPPTIPNAQRKARGAYYTPAPLVDLLLARALDPAIERALAAPNPREALLAIRVLDPSCGDGAFLVRAAARLMRAAGGCGAPIVERCVVGVDIDPAAARACEAALRDLAPGAAPRIVVADALREGPNLFGCRRFHAVVGNPPYLNQLERATVSSREVAQRVRAWSGDAVKGYADSAAAFWLLSTMLLAPEGRCALVLPRSTLSTRDASVVRAHIAARCAVDEVWFDDRLMFDAGVRVCAPVVRMGVAGARTARSCGVPPRTLSAGKTPKKSWSALFPDADAPSTPDGGVRTLAELVDATADFRDQYYGLRGCVLEDSEARRRCARDLETEFPKLVTSGLIDRDRLLWGERPARVHKRAWMAPRIDLAQLERDTDLGSWARARLVPKILLATQTRVLEPVLDESGRWLPCVPVITLTAKAGSVDPAGDLRRAHCALLSAEATAFAVREFSGAALSPGAIKLSAKQALMLPLEVEGSPAVREWFAARLAGGARAGVR